MPHNKAVSQPRRDLGATLYNVFDVDDADTDTFSRVVNCFHVLCRKWLVVVDLKSLKSRNL
jgi:hypothetical protein